MCYAYPGSMPGPPEELEYRPTRGRVSTAWRKPPGSRGQAFEPLGRLQLQILGCGYPYPGVERDSRGG